MKKVLTNDRKSYLHLILELLSERLHIKRYRIVLGKFVKVAHTKNLIAVIAQYEEDLEVSIVKPHAYMHKYINSIERVLESVI